MPIRFSHTPPNFALAFMLAPFAGAAATFVIAAVFSLFLLGTGELGFAGIIAIPGLAALYALGLCAVYTAVVGTAVVIFVRKTGITPKRGTAIVVGILVGFIPFAACAVGQVRGLNMFELSTQMRVRSALFTPMLALSASLSTAIAFWHLGLKNRPSSG